MQGSKILNRKERKEKCAKDAKGADLAQIGLLLVGA
jgi:hypothetical protein